MKNSLTPNMKELLLICAVVALVGGCGGKKETSKPQAKAKGTPKAADKKPLTKEESAKVIEAAIRKAAKKPTGELTKADLEKVTMLNLYNRQLTDVTGLENLTQLTYLNLYNNQLTDMKGLEKLTQLRILFLTGNQLTDVKGLEKLTQLEELVLSKNKLTDVRGLEKLTQLRKLNLNGNQLTDVKGLEKLKQLEWLDLVQWHGALTKAQIDQLQKTLPKCDIRSNPTK